MTGQPAQNVVANGLEWPLPAGLRRSDRDDPEDAGKASGRVDTPPAQRQPDVIALANIRGGNVGRPIVVGFDQSHVHIGDVGTFAYQLH